METQTTTAIVLFSGGQDSTTCLADALTRYDYVETVGFDYNQRHSVELECRGQVFTKLREKFPELDATVLTSLGETAMTHDVAIETDAAGLPTTFVPGRNLLFLTLAGALAARRGASVLVGGMCETDFSGYPDCRAATMASQEQTLRLGLDHYVTIETPLMWIDKAATWALAETLGGDALVDLIVEETHTCYLGDRAKRHDWGYGCGTCPACELRGNGWEKWKSGR
ncbi:UNVERIFIED_CONTAM: hypothetical protein GTU68_046075 [Idotea baltica]|nr:hypothetical protein [Idotea baltica]